MSGLHVAEVALLSLTTAFLLPVVIAVYVHVAQLNDALKLLRRIAHNTALQRLDNATPGEPAP